MLGKNSNKRETNTASSRMSRRIEELTTQVNLQKRVEEIMYTEVSVRSMHSVAIITGVWDSPICSY